nr:Cyclin-D1-1 [Ipomoea batatas]
MTISCSDCFSDLLCREDSDVVITGGGENLPECSNSEYESIPPTAELDESIASLIKNEQNFVPGIDYADRLQSQPIDAAAREDAIAWILKVHRYYGFQPLTAYLAVNYFDRFLYYHRLPQTKGWAIQLLSVACLSLAAKMEEPLVPLLLDLQVDSEKCIFEAKAVRRIELLVLSVLDWRLRSITPFSFLDFFASKIDSIGTFKRSLILRVTTIILSNIQEACLVEYRPSCIAAAATLCAANDLPDFSSVNAEHAVSWCHGLPKENIISCYQLMQKCATDIRPRRFPKVLPKVRVMARASVACSDLSSSPSFSTYDKRRKLGDSLWTNDDRESHSE